MVVVFIEEGGREVVITMGEYRSEDREGGRGKLRRHRRLKAAQLSQKLGLGLKRG